MSDRLLTMPEVAQRLNRPIGTLRDWRKKNRGPRSYRIEGRIMYRESEVEAWVTAQTTVAERSA